MFSAGLAVLQGSKSLIPRIFGVSSVRHGHRIRGKRPGVARTLAQRSEGMSPKHHLEVMCALAAMLKGSSSFFD